MRKGKMRISMMVVLLLALIWIKMDLRLKTWTTPQGVISSDVSIYYEYLPALFIYNDLSLDFKKNPGFSFKDKFWANHLPNNKFVIKMSMGLAMLYLPFFMMAHIYCIVSGIPADGFSDPYEIMLLCSSLFYAITGFIFLRKILKIYFNEYIVSFCMIVIGLGTNFLNYVTKEAGMSHVYLFCLFNIFVWYVILWYREKKLINIFFIGLTGALIALIRPTNILIFLIFFLYDVRIFSEIKNRINLLFRYKAQLVLLVFLFILVWLPQLIYWKIQTGQLFFFSYLGEHFYFGNPHIIDGFFSYRKGWLLYTPLMVFSLAGFIYMRKRLPEFFTGTLLFFLISSYVILSWWCWWYGGSFGNRAFIEMYGILALPMGCFFTYVYEKKWWKQALFTSLIFLLVGFQMFQSHQYHTGSIHWDSMTKEAYWASFMKSAPPTGWHYLLKEPDYETARESGKEKQ